MSDRKELATVEKCETCRFWRNSDGGDGICRRYPPNITGATTKYPSLYPVTHGDDWCGEYQPTPVPPAGQE